MIPLHPLWRRELEQILIHSAEEERPHKYMQFSRDNLLDWNHSSAILTNMDALEEMKSTQNLTLEQFASVGPFMLHQYRIKGSYYRSVTNKFRFSNHLQCKGCDFKIRIEIDFGNKEVTLISLGAHTCGDDDCHKDITPTFFLRSVLQSLITVGQIRTAQGLLRAAESLLGDDLPNETAKQEFQQKLGVNKISHSYAYNLIQKCPIQTHKTLGNQFDPKPRESKKRPKIGQQVWKITKR